MKVQKFRIKKGRTFYRGREMRLYREGDVIRVPAVDSDEYAEEFGCNKPSDTWESLRVAPEVPKTAKAGPRTLHEAQRSRPAEDPA